MDKKEFSTILQCALLSYDGVSENQMIFQYSLDLKLVSTGIKLCNYLKSK